MMDGGSGFPPPLKGNAKLKNMFKVGQKVVCVNPAPPLIKGEVYTIVGFHPTDKEGVLIKEVENESQTGYGFYYWRFRPIDETFAEEVLSNIKEQIKEEELILV